MSIETFSATLPNSQENFVKLQMGDPTTVEDFIASYYPRILSFVNHKIGDLERAKEIAQETFLKFHQRFQDLSQINLRSYLFKTAYNLSLNEFRDRKHELSPCQRRGFEFLFNNESPSPTDDYLFQIPTKNTYDNPESFTLYEELRLMVQESISHLPQFQREAILLRFFGGLELMEISEVMDKSVGAVKQLVHRGLENLKPRLSELVMEK